MYISNPTMHTYSIWQAWPFSNWQYPHWEYPFFAGIHCQEELYPWHMHNAECSYPFSIPDSNGHGCHIYDVTHRYAQSYGETWTNHHCYRSGPGDMDATSGVDRMLPRNAASHAQSEKEQSSVQAEQAMPDDEIGDLLKTMENDVFLFLSGDHTAVEF